MKVSDVCKQRTIKTTDVKTPLLVPSFSSKGFPDLGRMYADLKDHIPDASLVSAYDVNHEELSKDDIFSSMVVFIDSGGYETGKNGDMTDMDAEQITEPKPWDRELHADLVHALKPTCPLVIVSYDERMPLGTQIRQAIELFRQFPEYGSDFLVKPLDDKSETIPVHDLTKRIRELKSFDVLGVAEKELGSSFLDRCKNLVSLRAALQESGLDMPIHVFGSLDPLSVFAYFLCGADIFDGLSWLKYGYDKHLALYHLSYSIQTGAWHRPQKAVRRWMPVQNLISLSTTQTQMCRYAMTRDIQALCLEPTAAKELRELVEAAGLTF